MVVGGNTDGFSTRMTSAPRSASSWVRYGPDHTVVKSRTRMPRSGGSSGLPLPARPSLRFGSTRRSRRRRGRGWCSCQPPSSNRYGGPGQQDRAEHRVVASTQNPRWWKGRPPSPRPACTRPASGHCPAWAFAVASARVCSNSHGYSAVSRISLVPGSEKASGRENARGQRVVVDHLEHLLELLRRRHHRHVAVGAREDADGEQGVGRARGQAERLVLGVLPAEVAAHARAGRCRAPRTRRRRRARPRPTPARAACRPARRARRCGRPSRARRRGVRTGTSSERPCGKVTHAAELRGEIGPRVVGVGPGGAEAADGATTDRGELRADVVACEARNPRGRRHPCSRSPRRPPATRSRSWARPASSSAMRTARLLVLRCWYRSGCYRSGSPPGSSTFTTSAPRSAKTLPQYEPAGSVASSRTATSLSS